jgi:hypothetical protein
VAFDLNTWLKELNADGSLTQEELTAMTASLGKPGVLKALTAKHEDGLRQDEFSRRMNGLTEKEKATLALQGELVRWKQTAEAQLQQLTLTATQEREARQAIEAKFRQVAADYGLDPAQLGIPAATAGTGNGAGAGAQGTGTTGITTGAAEGPSRVQQLETAVTALPYMTAELLELQGEHQTLFGKPLPDLRGLVDRSLRAGQSMRKVWSEENKVPERQAQLQEEGVQARITAAVAKREGELRSELQLPPAGRPEHHSPVLAALKPASSGEQTGITPTVRAPSGVDRAVAAFNEHRYGPNAAGAG